MDAAYLASPAEALDRFQVSEQDGLSESQVQQALKKYGRNGTVHDHDSAIKQSIADPSA